MKTVKIFITGTDSRQHHDQIRQKYQGGIIILNGAVATGKVQEQ